MSFESIDHDEPDVIRTPTVSPWRGFVAAITGRRIAEHVTTHDDAVSELAAATQQLGAAQAQIAEQGREIAQLRDELTEAVKAADQLRAERNSLQAANRRLIQLAPETAEQTPAAASTNEQLRRQADQDRRNAVRLENELARLEGRWVL